MPVQGKEKEKDPFHILRCKVQGARKNKKRKEPSNPALSITPSQIKEEIKTEHEYLLNIHLLNLHILAIQLRDGNDQDAIVHSRRNSIDIHLGRVGATAQTDLALKDAHMALVEREGFQKVLVAGAVDDAREAEFALVGVPVHADVFLFGSREGDVDDVCIFGVEDVGRGGEVFRVGVVIVFVVVVVVAAELGGEKFANLAHVK